MEKNESFVHSGRPVCLHPDCLRDTYGGSRGLCNSHYAVQQALVKRGRTTWERLEAEGKVKPKLTAAENAFVRSNRSPKMKRVWLKDEQTFGFVKRHST